jgi:hypothetical protein
MLLIVSDIFVQSAKSAVDLQSIWRVGRRSGGVGERKSKIKNQKAKMGCTGGAGNGIYYFLFMIF